MSAVTADEAIPTSPEVQQSSIVAEINEENKTVEEDKEVDDELKLAETQPVSKEEPSNMEASIDKKAQSIDPASISPENLAQLRNSLVAAQAETSRLQSRNAELEDELAETSSKLTDVETQRTFLSAAKEAVETELKEEKRKREAAEENVEMLRGKVEDARKAIGTMRMGGEDKRMSSAGYSQGLGLGLGGSSADGLLSPELGSQEEPTGKRVKRASLLFNQGARRVSTGPPAESGEPTVPQSNPRTGLRELKLGTIASSVSPSSSPKMSQAAVSTPTNATHDFAENPELTPKDPRQRSQSHNLTLSPSGQPTYRLSDPYGDIPLSATSTSSRPRPGIAERLSSLTSVSDLSSVSGGNGRGTSPQGQFVNLNDDDNMTMTLMAQVTSLKSQLAEAHEARTASEDCLKALREFIALQNGGSTGADAEGSSVQGIKLPPLPTDRETDEDLAQQEAAKSAASAKKSGWGFNMWGAQPAPSTTTTVPSIHRMSRANSLATSIRSEAGDIPSADSSVRNVQLEPLRIGGQSENSGMKTSASSTTPLSNFVASWSRGITGGAPTPASATSPQPQPESATPVSAMPALAKRGFSFFGSKQKDVAVDDVKREAEESAELEKLKQTPEEEMDKDENALRRVSSGAGAELKKDDEGRGSVELDAKKDDDATLLKTSSTMKDDKYETVAF